MKQEFWIIKLTMSDGNVGYVDYNYDITRSFKYVATWLERNHAFDDLQKHIKNLSRNSTQVKRWLKDGAKVDYVKLIMEVKE